ncbi:MAG TPA: 3-deoxy-7-phosphoheptulonate synthase [Sphingomicrobium sp.]|nr:3-deoxy-7-phosphoheptulonate synthase [Sphingomicrobium sp.]
MGVVEMKMREWRPASWRMLPAAQMPAYPDSAALAAVELRLGEAVPVASTEDSARLAKEIARVAAGEAFVLQGGDCAESFGEGGAANIGATVDLFGAMSVLIAEGLGVPVVRIARIAGQFAKPRTSDVETRGGLSLPAYRGDIINGPRFDAASRTPDPARMLRAHHGSLYAAQLLQGSGVYTSHEALLLPYEQALTRRDGDRRWWSVSGHSLWLGDRTRQTHGAHVEFLRGIANPIGIKIGPEVEPNELLRLCEMLDPDNRPGRLMLIGRFGAAQISERLPRLMRATRGAGLAAVWMSDPMHGNTLQVGGIKLRRIDDIMSEIADFFSIARAERVHPGGVHLEMSALDVTECIGGRGPASIDELSRNYLSACDPRLNHDQALDLAGAIARLGARVAA